MGKRSVNRFPPFESSPMAGVGTLERGERVGADVLELCRSVLCWRWCWDKENKRCFSAYANGIWMARKKVGNSDETWR